MRASTTPIPAPGFDPLRMHTAPGVRGVTPQVDERGRSHLRGRGEITIYRPWAPVQIYGDMAGDLGAAYGPAAPRPDVTAVTLAGVLHTAGRRVQVVDASVDSEHSAESTIPTRLVLMKVALPSWRTDLIEAGRLRAAGHDIVLFGATVEYLPSASQMDLGHVFGDAPTALASLLSVTDVLIGAAYRMFPLHRYRDEFGRVLAHLQASRGCSRTCLYCPYIRNFGRWAGRSPDAVQADFRDVIRMGAEAIQFRDQDFASDREHALSVAAAIAKLGANVPWRVEGNLDKFDDELLDVLAATGCEEVIFGLESVDPMVLKTSRRRVFNDTADRVGAIRARGIRARGLFVLGLPEDELFKIVKTLDWALTLGLDAAQFNAYSPLPGEAFGNVRPAILDDFAPMSNDYRFKTCRSMSRHTVKWAASTCQAAFDSRRVDTPSMRRLRRMAAS